MSNMRAYPIDFQDIDFIKEQLRIEGYTEQGIGLVFVPPDPAPGHYRISARHLTVSSQPGQGLNNPAILDAKSQEYTLVVHLKTDLELALHSWLLRLKA